MSRQCISFMHSGIKTSRDSEVGHTPTPATVLPFTHYLLTTYHLSVAMIPSQASSSRSQIRNQARHHPYHQASESMVDTITSILEVAEKALDNGPVTGAKAAVGSILLVLKRVDVRSSSMSIQHWLTVCCCRQVGRT